MNWPTGVGARGSSGVAGVVTRTEGAIGYADVAYALENKIKFAAVQNKSGKWATPGLRAIRAAAAADKKFSRTNELSIVNPPKGKKFAAGLSDLHLLVRHRCHSSPRRPRR